MHPLLPPCYSMVCPTTIFKYGTSKTHSIPIYPLLFGQPHSCIDPRRAYSHTKKHTFPLYDPNDITFFHFLYLFLCEATLDKPPQRFYPCHTSVLPGPLSWYPHYVTPHPSLYPISFPDYSTFLVVNLPQTSTICKYFPSDSGFWLTPPLYTSRPIPPQKGPCVWTNK